VKILPVLLVSLAFAIDGFAQTPTLLPLQVAQAAGGASRGADVQPAPSGAASPVAAAVAGGVAAVVALATSNSTSTAPSH
jgi:hypothetical protein